MKWKGHEQSEAMSLKNEAMIVGVAESDLLIEEISTNTLENVLASLIVLDREFRLCNMKRLLVVTTSYHMRRLYLTLKTYMPDWIDFTLCPAEDNKTRESNWFTSRVGRKRVKDECAKLIHYTKQGAVIDRDMDV